MNPHTYNLLATTVKNINSGPPGFDPGLASRATITLRSNTSIKIPSISGNPYLPFFLSSFHSEQLKSNLSKISDDFTPIGVHANRH